MIIRLGFIATKSVLILPKLFLYFPTTITTNQTHLTHCLNHLWMIYIELVVRLKSDL